MCLNASTSVNSFYLLQFICTNMISTSSDISGIWMLLCCTGTDPTGKCSYNIEFQIPSNTMGGGGHIHLLQPLQTTLGVLWPHISGGLVTSFNE